MASDISTKIKILKQKKKRKLLVLGFISSISLSMLYIYTYTLNTPIRDSKLPIINIYFEDNGINNEHYIDCIFELDSDKSEDVVTAIKSKIKVRGDFNAGRPKKGYRIELSQQESLLGMRKDDDWILFAMYFDIPRIRVKTAFEIWKSLEPKDSTAVLPELKYINLYINGEYQGLYLLAEKNDRRIFGLDDAQNNIDSSLIIQAKGAIFDSDDPYPTIDIFKGYVSNEWEQDWPNEDEGIYIMDEIMSDLIFFVNNASDKEFFNPLTGIYSKFDKINLIDFYLFNFLILHKDMWMNNFFIIRNTNPNKFYLIPWDFDYTFGQKLDEKYMYDENLETDIHNRNKLFSRLISNEEFMKSCKNRWFELREDIWTDDSILGFFYDNYDEVETILRYEAHLTYSDEFKKEINVILDEVVEHLFQWVPNRLDFCDLYFLSF